jgi:hypothetical protein
MTGSVNVRVRVSLTFLLLAILLKWWSPTTDGERYFKQRPQLGPVPLFGDLERGTRLLRKFEQLRLRLQNRLADDSNDIIQQIWTMFARDTKFRDSRVLLGSFSHLHNVDDQPHPVGSALASMRDDFNVTAARLAASHCRIDWLQRHGTCADNIVGQPSLLPHAGMGAFARRALRQDSVVAHLPMIGIADRGRLDMFALHQDGARDWVPVNDTVMGHQLLLNYCYGHASSTLLLCPYSPMVNYVNHNQTLANVRLAWPAAKRNSHLPHYLNTTVNQIAYAGSAVKIAMDLIALRDIQAGEEILLDYGSEWETAWQDHAARWTTTPSRNHTASMVARLESDRTLRLRTVFEEIDEPLYPPEFQLRCDSAVLWQPSDVQEHYWAGTLDEFLWERQSDWWPCFVLRSRLDENDHRGVGASAGEYLYMVHLLRNDDEPPGVLVHNVPRDAIHFVHRPYTSETFGHMAFRHDIRIPKTLFPKAWRNR